MTPSSLLALLGTIGQIVQILPGMEDVFKKTTTLIYNRDEPTDAQWAEIDGYLKTDHAALQA